MEFEMVSCCVCGMILPNRGGLVAWCQSCDKTFCMDCYMGDWSDESFKNGTEGMCQFCMGEDATDDQLLEFALKKLALSKDELKEECLREFNHGLKK
jgi:hypothetical protein